MNKKYQKALLSATAAFMLIISPLSAVLAAGPGYYPPGPRPAPGYDRPGPPPAYNNRYRSSDSWRGSHGQFRHGYAVPAYYRGNRYVLNDWRRYNLYAPPRGHQWLFVDGNFVLAAIGTGIVTQILLGR